MSLKILLRNQQNSVSWVNLKKKFGSGSGYMDVCSVVADVAKCDNNKNKLFFIIFKSINLFLF